MVFLFMGLLSLGKLFSGMRTRMEGDQVSSVTSSLRLEREESSCGILIKITRWTTLLSFSAHFLKSGFVLAVSRDTLPSIYQPPESLSPRRGLTVSPRCGRDAFPSICKHWYFPSPAGVQLLSAATRSLLAYFDYTQIRSKSQLFPKNFMDFFANSNVNCSVQSNQLKLLLTRGKT